MLTHLKLENFKIWRSTGPMRLAFITLLLGTNSSGKSSLIQSLLLIRRTVKGEDPNLDLNVYDRAAGRLWNSARRDELARVAGLAVVPRLATGRYRKAQLKTLVSDMPSRFRGGSPLGGVVVRRNDGNWCDTKAKLIRPDFAQAIDEHWRRRTIEWNRVVPETPTTGSMF